MMGPEDGDSDGHEAHGGDGMRTVGRARRDGEGPERLERDTDLARHTDGPAEQLLGDGDAGLEHGPAKPHPRCRRSPLRPGVGDHVDEGYGAGEPEHGHGPHR